MTDYTLASRLIAHFEMFSANAYWDVNAWRIGYGSDTRTKDQIKVKQGDTTTEQEAEDNLTIRVKQFEQTIVNQLNAGHPATRAAALAKCPKNDPACPLCNPTAPATDAGAEAWEKVPDNAKAALLSFAYNYGHLPSSVLNAVLTDDLHLTSTAIAARQVDNNGINRTRRLIESAFAAVA
jgi:GH24 family phage-related lysozyme (muramidase)